MGIIYWTCLPMTFSGRLITSTGFGKGVLGGGGGYGEGSRQENLLVPLLIIQLLLSFSERRRILGQGESRESKAKHHN
jgi:hypothetical protein